MPDDKPPTPFDRMLLPVDAVVQHVISRIDINAIVEQVDVNELISRVDIDAVVERSVRRATRRTLDLARAFGANLDDRVTDAVDHVLRRPPGWRPRSPAHAPTTDAQEL